MEAQSQIKCPECGCDINVNDVLEHQLEDKLRKEFQAKFAKQSQQLKEESQKLEAQKAEMEEKLLESLKAREAELKIKIKSQLESEQDERFKALQEELQEKTNKVKDLYKTELELEKLKRDKEEAVAKAKLDAQKELNSLLQIEREKLKKEAQDASELKIRELEKKLKDQIDLTEEMKRKQQQGSMQLQGEIQELAIEEWLRNHFPLDTIEEIKKGASGADCLQVVNTREVQNCGTIYYESKRTKNFQPAWIEKFKNDIRNKNASVGVLVTEVLPNGMDRMGLMDGIWVCTYEEFKSLCAVLRESIIKLNIASESQVNKGEKMEMLYAYLTSNEFKLQIEGIVEGFSQMKQDLDKERSAMERIWTQREKQIDKVVLNTVHMYGSLKGIAGGAVPVIKTLELNG